MRGYSHAISRVVSPVSCIADPDRRAGLIAVREQRSIGRSRQPVDQQSMVFISAFGKKHLPGPIQNLEFRASNCLGEISGIVEWK